MKSKRGQVMFLFWGILALVFLILIIFAGVKALPLVLSGVDFIKEYFYWILGAIAIFVFREPLINFFNATIRRFV